MWWWFYAYVRMTSVALHLLLLCHSDLAIFYSMAEIIIPLGAANNLFRIQITRLSG
jgi:hypothetical protein